MDFDGDGHADLLSGSWPGELYLFRGEGGGSFAAGVAIAGRAGGAVRADYASTAFAVDRDVDGDLDLLVGSFGGAIFLVPNEGTRRSPAFGAPGRLVGEEVLGSAFGGDSGPMAADWDGDGRLDLVVGTGSGAVVRSRNLGTPREPRLSGPETLIPAAHPAAEAAGGGPGRGLRAKVCVTDWDGDGRLALLAGDFGAEFEKELGAEEAAWRIRRSAAASPRP